MTTLKFILRPSKRSGLHRGSLCARIIHCRKVITLPISLYDHEWDAQGQNIILCGDEASRYDCLCRAMDIIEEYRSQFQQAIARLEKTGRYQLCDIVLGCRLLPSRQSLLGFTRHLSRMLERSGQGRTARAYLTACRSFVAFNKGKDIPLKQINTQMIKEFEIYLKERGKALNTISYYMRMLRAIYRKALKEKLLDGRNNPFLDVFTGLEKTRKRALNIGQLQHLNNLDFSQLLKHPQTKLSPPQNNMYECWRYFFFCFHARGMSFVDLAYLRKDNIHQGVICYYRKKTGQKIEVTITPVLRDIINSFADETRFTPYLFPVIRYTDKPHRLQYENGLRLQNRRLKQLAACAGIELRWGLTTHVTRHSWATTGKMQNLPLSVISEGLGHSSEKMTYTYLASFDRSTIDKANECIARAIDLQHEENVYNRINS